MTGQRAESLQALSIDLRDPIPRRRRLFLFFAALALAGTFIRWLAPAQSELSRFGAMLLILWIPVASHFIFYVLKRRSSGTAGSEEPVADSGFQAEIVAEVSFTWPLRNDGRHPVPGREYPCIFAIGAEGYSARFVVPVGVSNDPDVVQRMTAEFLVPAVALPRFLVGTVFKVLEGQDYRGEGRVLEVLG